MLLFIKDKNFFSLKVFVKELEIYTQKNKFTSELKKNMDINIGKLNQLNFEGYIGPILIFKKYFEEIPRIFLDLKGSYEKALFYFRDYDTSSVDIYIKKENYIENKEDLSKFLIAYIAPLEQDQKLNKSYYYNTTFIETKISFNKEPLMNNNCSLFIHNNISVFEFI